MFLDDMTDDTQHHDAAAPADDAGDMPADDAAGAEHTGEESHDAGGDHDLSPHHPVQRAPRLLEPGRKV